MQEEATRQGISVNVLLNRFLRKYSLFSRWSERNNDVLLPPQTFREIIGTVQVEKLAEAGTKSGFLECYKPRKFYGVKDGL